MPFTREAAAKAKIDETKNIYLDDAKSEGLKLVASIISAHSENSKSIYYKLDTLLDRELTAFSDGLRIQDAAALYTRLLSLSDRLGVPEKYQLLQRRSVIGLGGMFSSGKSCVINSLLDGANLPVGQRPMTSVPTYLISGETTSSFAYTKNGARILLDAPRLEAISHEFDTEYGLELAQFLSFIAISLPGLPAEVALLDTPGYSKPNGNAQSGYTDAEKARTQLRTIDAMIWVLDVTNGTLREDDIRFIRDLNPAMPVLFIVNKSDLRPDESVKVADEVRRAAESKQIPVFDVVRYSAFEPQDYPESKEKIWDYFDQVSKQAVQAEDIKGEIEQIINSLEQAFGIKIQELQQRRNIIGETIFRSNSILEIGELASLYGNINGEIINARSQEHNFDQTVKELKRILWKLLKTPCA